MGKREITKNTLIFASATMLSRILGFIRDILIATYFGATPASDAFFVAFRIPNLFRRLLGEGALSSAFIPVFAQEEKRHKTIRHVLNSAFSSLLIVLTLLLIAGELFTPQLVALIAPGFIKAKEQLLLTVKLTKITFPYIYFMGMAILMGAALNYKKDFFYTSLSPCLLNICIIASILTLSRHLSEPIFALAWGVFAGGILQILFHLYGAKKLKVLPNPLSKPFTEPVKKALKLMAPATVGLAIHQINTLIDTVIASFLPEGSISFLYYANRLFQLPLALFGIAIGAVLLPYAAQSVANGQKEEVLDNAAYSIDFVMYVTIPAALGLVVFAFPIIDVLFRRGIFSLSDAQNTAYALAMYALGLPFISVAKILVSLFHSHMDMKTPVKAAAVALVVNVVLNLILMHPLKHAGLALATSAAAVTQLLYLALALKRLDVHPKQLIPKNLKSTLAACIITLTFMLVLYKLLPFSPDKTFLNRALHIFTYVTAAAGCHILIGVLLKIEPARMLLKFRRR